MSLRVEVDRAACQGARACIRRAPRTFALDADRRAVVTAAPGEGDSADAVRDAVQACPNFALKLREAAD